MALITIFPCAKTDPKGLSEENIGLTHKHTLAYLQKEVLELWIQAGGLVGDTVLTRRVHLTPAFGEA